MEQTFNMAATAEAFNILSSSLYSNPKLAIIRELSTNANDAHKQAGKEDYPFDLHLPTKDEPFFDIRDFGDGIPEDLIYNIYTSYFVSTKTDDENQTGCFGLGSKTPFSLVDSYDVISYCEGKKKTYRMSKKNGLPCVEKVAEEDWTKDTGLEIRFNWTADRDWYFDEWNDEADKFFRSTNFMPNVNTFLNNENFNWDEFMEDRKFHSFDSIDIGHCYRPEIAVNVAGVGFNVNYNDLKAKGDNLKDMLDRAGVKRVNIMANKSDVTLTPSREVLHYDDKTIDFIYTNVVKVVDEYYQKLNDKFDEYNYSDAMNLMEYQRYDQDLNDRFRTKMFDTFFQKALDVRGNGRGKSITVASPADNGGWRSRPKKTYLVDFNGIKTTVKQNVVDNFLALQTFDDKGKLTSTSFADVIKRIGGDNTDDYRVLFPKNYKDAANLKACKDFVGENVEVVNWATACEYKKEAGSSGRKLGFKTRQTISYDNNGNYRYGYTTSPDLQDDEVGVLVSENVDLYYIREKIQVLRDLGLTFKIVARPCKESVFKKYKEKGFLTLDEYIKTLVDANIDKIRDDMIVAKKNYFVRNYISYAYEPKIAEVFNNPAYDSLMSIEDFKNIRELYKEENYTTDFKRSFTTVIGIDGVPEYKRPTFEGFPLFGKISFSDENDWKNFLDYVLLYKDSQFFQVEKKIAEEVA